MRFFRSHPRLTIALAILILVLPGAWLVAGDADDDE